MKYQIKDRGSILRFEGVKLAESSSRDYKPRWIEFTLYKTTGGQYIIERVGRSIVFHRGTCRTVEKNNLSSVYCTDIPSDHEPCEWCRPSRIDLDGLYPERERPYYIECKTAKGVVRELTSQDRDNDTEYITNVARKLLDDASKMDADIHDHYKIRTIE